MGEQPESLGVVGPVAVQILQTTVNGSKVGYKEASAFFSLHCWKKLLCNYNASHRTGLQCCTEQG